jgi:hypothetical protein
MRFAGQSEAEAYEAVSRMANQLAALAQQAAWWPAHGSAAVAETIRYTAFDSDVPSRPAQLAFPEQSTPAPPRGDARRAWLADRKQAHQAWLAAWEAWAARRQ